jgi:hypothetical protein
VSLPDLWQAIDFASRIQTGQKSTDPGVLILVNQANRMKRLNTGSMDQTDHPPYRRYAPSFQKSKLELPTGVKSSVAVW